MGAAIDGAGLRRAHGVRNSGSNAAWVATRGPVHPARAASLATSTAPRAPPAKMRAPTSRSSNSRTTGRKSGGSLGSTRGSGELRRAQHPDRHPRGRPTVEVGRPLGDDADRARAHLLAQVQADGRHVRAVFRPGVEHRTGGSWQARQEGAEHGAHHGQVRLVVDGGGLGRALVGGGADHGEHRAVLRQGPCRCGGTLRAPPSSAVRSRASYRRSGGALNCSTAQLGAGALRLALRGVRAAQRGLEPDAVHRKARTTGRAVLVVLAVAPAQRGPPRQAATGGEQCAPGDGEELPPPRPGGPGADRTRRRPAGRALPGVPVGTVTRVRSVGSIGSIGSIGRAAPVGGVRAARSRVPPVCVMRRTRAVRDRERGPYGTHRSG